MLAIIGSQWCSSRKILAQSRGARLRVEYAELSLQGGRDTNQDRIGVAVAPEAALLCVCDGMGGHADGDRAAESARRVILERFRKIPQPLLDPLGFLQRALGSAHDSVVALGPQLPIELRPRATCAVCLVQESSAYWAHVGDSRVYHLRGGKVRERTRDHSHVELLLREGVISVGEVTGHPMRSYVESCLGGDPILPDISLSPRRALRPDDVLLVCTDGFWSALDDERIGSAFGIPGVPLAETLALLAAQAVSAAGGASDNTSVAALRLLTPAS
jgi:PPM family protein phosphatase